MSTQLHIEYEVRPFDVPSFVTTVSPDGQAKPVLRLAHLPAELLGDMCDQFRRDVFAKVGKKDPRGLYMGDYYDGSTGISREMEKLLKADES